MSDTIDDVLDQCLTDLFSGASSVEECLVRYPEHASQLEALLRTASQLETGSGVQPPPGYRQRTRTTLKLHMQAHPRVVDAPLVVTPRRTLAPFWRMMTGLVTMIVTLFITGTVYAQGSLPGDPFYKWKLVSEDAWRVVSPDTVKTDLKIANRRINEMKVTLGDHSKWSSALKGYREVRSRLEVEVDASSLDNILPPAETFTDPAIPTLTPEPVTEPQELSPTATIGEQDKDQTKQDKKKDEEKNNSEKRNNGKKKGPVVEVTPTPQPIISEPTPLSPTPPQIISEPMTLTPTMQEPIPELTATTEIVVTATSDVIIITPTETPSPDDD